MRIRTSRTRTLRTVLFSMFSLEKGQPLSSVLLFIWSFFSLSWFTNSSTDFWIWWGGYILGTTDDHCKSVYCSFIQLKKALVPFSLLIVTLIALYLNYRRNQDSTEIIGVSPKLYRGLIVQLSVYSARNSKYKNPQDVSTALREGQLDIAELLKSNFGPLILAVRYHAPILEKCWILTTKESKEQYPLVADLVKFVVGRDIQCSPIPIPDPNDIGSTAREVRSIYLEDKLPSKDIIADFTGGTAAMSGGMILATIDEDQDLEYLRQDRCLFNHDGTPKNNDTIRKEAILLSPRTSREMIGSVFADR